MTSPDPTITSSVLGPDPDRPDSSTVSADAEAGLTAAEQQVQDQATAAVIKQRVADANEAVSSGGEPPSTVAAFRDQAGRIHYANRYAKGTVRAVESGEWEEADQAALQFSPRRRKVRDIIEYLRAHAGDADEVQRVKDAEAAGENRPTIDAWQPGQ